MRTMMTLWMVMLLLVPVVSSSSSSSSSHSSLTSSSDSHHTTDPLQTMISSDSIQLHQPQQLSIPPTSKRRLPWLLFWKDPKRYHDDHNSTSSSCRSVVTNPTNTSPTHHHHQSNELMPSNDNQHHTTIPPPLVLPLWKQNLPEPLASRSTLERIVIPIPPLPLSSSSSSSLSDPHHRRSPGNIFIYLLGTAHVSNESSRDVELLLDHVDPNCIFVELCHERAGIFQTNAWRRKMMMMKMKMMATMNSSISNETVLRSPTMSMNETNPYHLHHNYTIDMMMMMNLNNISLWEKFHKLVLQKSDQQMSRTTALVLLLCSEIQENLAKLLGVQIAEELRVAYQYYCRSYFSDDNDNNDNGGDDDNGGNHHHHQQRRINHFILGDRPMGITIRRAWNRLSWWSGLRLVITLIQSWIMPPSPQDLQTTIQQLLQQQQQQIHPHLYLLDNNNNKEEEKEDPLLVSSSSQLDENMLTKFLAEFNQSHPTLFKILIEERDAYMACKLFQICRDLIVAYWTQRIELKQQILEVLSNAKHLQEYIARDDDDDEEAQRKNQSKQQILETVAQRLEEYMTHEDNPEENYTSWLEKTVEYPPSNITIVAIVGAGHVHGITQWFINGNGKTPEQVLQELVLDNDEEEEEEEEDNVSSSKWFRRRRRRPVNHTKNVAKMKYQRNLIEGFVAMNPMDIF